MTLLYHHTICLLTVAGRPYCSASDLVGVCAVCACCNSLTAQVCITYSWCVHYCAFIVLCRRMVFFSCTFTTHVTITTPSIQTSSVLRTVLVCCAFLIRGPDERRRHQQSPPPKQALHNSYHHSLNTSDTFIQFRAAVFHQIVSVCRAIIYPSTTISAHACTILEMYAWQQRAAALFCSQIVLLLYHHTVCTNLCVLDCVLSRFTSVSVAFDLPSHCYHSFSLPLFCFVFFSFDTLERAFK